VDSSPIYFVFHVGDVLRYVSLYRQIVKTINFCLSDQNGILLRLVFSNLGDVVNRRQGVVSARILFYFFYQVSFMCFNVTVEICAVAPKYLLVDCTCP
jgi:hypothetical protein